MQEINELQFVRSKTCAECMRELVEIYANLFEGGDFNKAKVKLLESISWSRWSVSSAFKVGLKIGVLLGLMVWTMSALWTDQFVVCVHFCFPFKSLCT